MGTQSTKAELDTALANNTGRLITPAKLRDFVESALPSAGSLVLASVLTPIALAGTYVKASNTTTLAGASRFTMPVDNRLTYGGTADVTATVWGAVALTAAIAAQTIAVGIALNGAVVANSVIKVVAGTDLVPVPLIAIVDLVPDDYIEIWVANDTSAEDLTIAHGHLRAIAFLT